MAEYAGSGDEAVTEVDIRKLDPNRNQPRRSFDQEKLEELAQSLKRHGMVQPILVQKKGERYTIVAGERRYRAARLAGLFTVPVVVKELPEDQVLEVALIENLQREDLNPIETAAAIRFLMEQHDLTQEEVAKRIGKSRPAVANSLRLLSLAKPVQEMLKEGILQAGHARVLCGIKDAAVQAKLADAAIREGWSVREMEQRAKAPDAPKAAKGGNQAARLSPELYDAQERLQAALGAKVRIQGDETRGRIVIEYYTGTDLEHIYDAIVKE